MSKVPYFFETFIWIAVCFEQEKEGLKCLSQTQSSGQFHSLL